ncbi:MAG: hypothetical protein M3Y87_16005 [Myxococcota bacterium]|nr:hypothetical protein [Myxococcota bacterium]
MATSAGDILGRAGGVALAPLTATVSAIRRSRMFHPRGTTLRAEVRAIAGEPPWSTIAARLEGPALVRLSSAWWKKREWPDVLGCAIRFTSTREPDARPQPGDQDLLLATIRRPWTMPFAPLTTNHHDFFANDYYAVSPFSAEPAGTIEWRLAPDHPVQGGGGAHGAPREQRLAVAVERGDAMFTLEARPYRRVIDLARAAPWSAIARIELIETIAIDDDALRFDPYRAGRGIEPVGFVQSLRIGAYAAGQRARPDHG